MTIITLPPSYHISININGPGYPWGRPYTVPRDYYYYTQTIYYINPNRNALKRKDSGIYIPSNATSHKPSTITINPEPPTTTTTKTTTTTTPARLLPPSRWTTLTTAEQTKALAFLTNNYHTISTLQASNYTITPNTIKNNIHFQPTPNTTRSARQAVSLDCEMVTDTTGRTQLCQVSLVDILTGELLLDQPVLPTAPISDWRTNWSGMTADLMAEHIAAGRTVTGYEGARARVWEFVNKQTILVGQSLNFDLDVLGIVHERVVDTYLLMRGERRGRSCRLRDIVRDCCGVEIQKGEELDNGHDCAEDCYAAREVALWAVENLGKDTDGGSTRGFCVESFM
ncbi:hypothetical protein AbraIFM66950_008466 [Aspergillus brasiliensis]|nr:hypothetical protein AbraIFM66950_008466 [Aspergillus brasiliensis]